MSSAQVILSARCWFFTEFKLIMLPEGSSEHCALDKFSLFSKAFLSISNAPLWQVEGKRAKFCGRAVFPALRCQELSKRSFFTSKKIDRFGLVTQPDQASVLHGSEYKWSGRTNQRWFTSGPQGRNAISKSLHFFWQPAENSGTRRICLTLRQMRKTQAPLRFLSHFVQKCIHQMWKWAELLPLPAHFHCADILGCWYRRGRTQRIQAANAHWSADSAGSGKSRGASATSSLITHYDWVRVI